MTTDDPQRGARALLEELAPTLLGTGMTVLLVLLVVLLGQVD